MTATIKALTHLYRHQSIVVNSRRTQCHYNASSGNTRRSTTCSAMPCSLWKCNDFQENGFINVCVHSKVSKFCEIAFCKRPLWWTVIPTRTRQKTQVSAPRHNTAYAKQQGVHTHVCMHTATHTESLSPSLCLFPIFFLFRLLLT